MGVCAGGSVEENGGRLKLRAAAWPNCKLAPPSLRFASFVFNALRRSNIQTRVLDNFLLFLCDFA